MKTTISILFFAVLLLELGCTSSDSSKKTSMDNPDLKLKLTLKSDKNEYSIDEPINISVSLENTSKEDVVINDRFLMGYESRDDKEFYFQIYDARGKRFDSPENSQADISPVPVRETNIRTLEPNQIIEQTINLAFLYRMEKGEYKIVGKYKSTPYDGKNSIYSETTVSDTITISIK